MGKNSSCVDPDGDGVCHSDETWETKPQADWTAEDWVAYKADLNANPPDHPSQNATYRPDGTVAASTGGKPPPAGLNPIGYAVGGAVVGYVVSSFLGMQPLFGAALGGGAGYLYGAAKPALAAGGGSKVPHSKGATS